MVEWGEPAKKRGEMAKKSVPFVPQRSPLAAFQTLQGQTASSRHPCRLIGLAACRIQNLQGKGHR